jgi:hypothetical protein
VESSTLEQNENTWRHGEDTLADFTGLIETMKKAAVDAVEAGKPMVILFGRVDGVNPLRIWIEQKMVLEARDLVLTRSVTDYFDSGKNENVYGALRVGEEVVIIQMQGGQRYVILDRLG